MASDGETWAQVVCFVLVFVVIIASIVISRRGGDDEEALEEPLRDAVPHDGEAGLPESRRCPDRSQVVPAHEW